MMDKGIKADWLTALRSGEYKQGKGFLKSQQGEHVSYCCLGVLCELAAKAGIVEDSEVDEDAFVHTFDGQSSYLPPKVAIWADIQYQGKIYREGDTGSISDRRVSVDLADLNDYKLDFAGIADVIEKEF
jgi:hypothetical protein